MQKKQYTNNNVGRRAWNLLRLAIIWARKGGVFKRRFLMDLRLVPKFIKSLGHSTSTPPAHLHYGDHELSFDDTPLFRLNIHRPTSLRFHFPCITPQPVDFKYEFDDDGIDDVSEICSYDGERRSSGYDGGEEREDDDEYQDQEDGIDLRAEKFIAEFYQQMKMQRQISFSKYDKSL